MPFIFNCSRCRSILYEDLSPILQNGCYKSPTYLESILMKLGDKCPSCGHRLQIPPSKIEIFAPTKEDDSLKKEPRTQRIIFQ
jgi:DNA-directed RNA polymerase subunit RPC12/RpoP